MTTLASRGTSIVGTTSTVWTGADVATVCDGAVGSTTNTYCRWQNNDVSEVGTLTIGYDFSSLDANAVISAATATIRHYEQSTNRYAGVTLELQTNTGTPIGSAQAVTLSGIQSNTTVTVGTPSQAQAAAGLRIKITATRYAGTLQSTFNVDFVDVTLTYEIAASSTSTDQLGLTDAVTAVKNMAAAAATDQLGATDTATRVIAADRPIKDTTHITDSVLVDMPGVPTSINVYSPGPKPSLHTDFAVTVHTVAGVVLDTFGPQDMTELVFGYELRDVSTCNLTLPPMLTLTGRAPEIVPWLHQVTVWDMATRTPLWSGPIQAPVFTRQQTRISAKDPAAWMARTRVPLTKRWENVDPSVPAAELWRALIEAHSLKTPLIVRPDLQGGLYDYQVIADDAMLDTTMNDLVGLGLRWTVVAGTVVIGPAPREPVAELGENDFVGDGFELRRDGAAVFNDVLLRGPDSLARARTPLYGLNLQTLVKVDSMFGVSNVEAATTQYARYSGKIRDTLGAPSGVVLHPHAPLAWDQMVPSTRFSVSAFGGRFKMELESVTASVSAGRAEVAVRLESVTDIPDLPELSLLSSRKTTPGVPR